MSMGYKKGIFAVFAYEFELSQFYHGIEIGYLGEHVFRHTFATNCYYKGVNVKILSKLLGHADVNVTYNIYVHLYGDGFDEMYSALVPEG